MTVDTTWAVLVVMLLVFAAAASPLLRFVDDDVDAPAEGAAAPRALPIDGLRGFLAFGVFLFHLVITQRYIATGVWTVPDAPVVARLGAVGVSVFFMVTGFLFWGKLLRTRGRPGWWRLYVGRLFRIVPVYLVVVLAMLAIVAARSGFVLHEPGPDVALQALQWLALGMIDTQPDVNGQVATHILAGVTWTLWYEWVFYAALPLLAPLARLRRHGPAVLLLVVVCLAAKWRLQTPLAGFAALFAIGMAVASWRHGRPPPRGGERLWSAAALLALVAAFVNGNGGYESGNALALGMFFAAVAGGASLGGLLLTPAAQRLGRISYSLYLMQGLALTLVFAAGPVARLALRSDLGFWTVGLVCAVVLVVAAALGHRWIERPGIALGRRVAGEPGPTPQHRAVAVSFTST